MSLLHPLPLHRAHDVDALLALWRGIAEDAGLQATVIGEVSGWPVMAYRSSGQGPVIYLSTGVHGDEAGSAWGLVEWARSNVEALRSGAFAICPCLNPGGLRNNTRVDERGVDLNRRFHDDSDPLIAAWQQWIDAIHPRAGICLHEDYDAQGCYVYELSTLGLPLCESIMPKVDRVIPRDPRREIDISIAEHGIIKRSEIPADIQGPEAIVLRRFGCDITLTFETPSEFALDTRVLAQRTFLEAALEHLSPLLRA